MNKWAFLSILSIVMEYIMFFKLLNDFDWISLIFMFILAYIGFFSFIKYDKDKVRTRKEKSA